MMQTDLNRPSYSLFQLREAECLNLSGYLDLDIEECRKLLFKEFLPSESKNDTHNNQ